jgi:proteasome lid subunit RPN8/RPN11
MDSSARQLISLPTLVFAVQIHRPVLDYIRRCTLGSPYEACGALYGYIRRDDLIISAVRSCHNHDQAPDGFALDFEDLFHCPERHADAGLVGIFHSHPAESAHLSAVDCFFLNRARWVWLVSGSLPNSNEVEIRCYVRARKRIQEINYAVIENTAELVPG